jgi:electron transfer flavoprotein alpha subunit
VIIERKKEEVHPATLELLTKGRELCAVLGQTLVAVIPGTMEEGDENVFSRYGAQEILEVRTIDGNPACFDLAAETLCMAVSEEKPSIILAGATAFGRTIMPLLAVRLRTGLTADCTELDIDREKKLLLQTRPAFGGNILAVIECAQSKPQMATVRPHVFKMTKIENARKPVTRHRSYSPQLRRSVELLERVVEDEKTDITQADIIVSGGRGLGKPEGFELLNTLADQLGGMTGASRGAVDLGWISPAHQVGQTGHTVNPKLYVACGISGAVQHIAGMKGAEMIVAINEDPEAPIFEIADYGIIGDLYEIIPAIIEALPKGGPSGNRSV